MKKLLLLVLPVFLLILLPTKIFAAVDLAVKDTSTTTLKQVALGVESNTDTLTGFTIAIQASSDVTITKVEQGTSTSCGTFSSTNQNNVVTVTCTMETATAVTGNIANITFTSTGTAYKFTILENSTLDLGDLTVGTVTNVDNTDTVTATQQKTENTTTTKTTTTTTTETFKDKIMDYLPYVLIGGAVILLISIVGILLSKKKNSDKETPVESIPEVKPEVTPVQPESEIPQTTPVNMENLSNNLYSPAPANTPIQDVIGNTAPTTEETPFMQEQPTFVPTEVKVPEQNQSSDLQAIMQQESHSESTTVPTEQDPTVQSPTPVQVPEQSFIAPTNVTELPTTFDSQPAQEIPSTPLPDLQQFVNLQASQAPESAPSVMTTPTAPTIENNPTPTAPSSVPPVAF